MGRRGRGTRNKDTSRSATTTTSLLRAWRRGLCGSCHSRRSTTFCARRLGDIIGCLVLSCGWLGRLGPNRRLGWLRSWHIAFHLPFQAKLIVNTSVLVDKKEVVTYASVSGSDPSLEPPDPSVALDGVMSSPSPELPDVLALALALVLSIEKHAFSRKKRRWKRGQVNLHYEIQMS